MKYMTVPTYSKYVHSTTIAVPVFQHVLSLHLQDVLLLRRARHLEQLRTPQLHDVIPLQLRTSSTV